MVPFLYLHRATKLSTTQSPTTTRSQSKVKNRPKSTIGTTIRRMLDSLYVIKPVSIGIVYLSKDQVGGGIAAALLTAGGAYLAKKHHDGKHDEVGNDNAKAWVDEARARTETFHREGPRGPATWVLTQGKDFPPSAIEAGNHHSSPLYISRAYLDGGIQIGAASDAFHKGAIFGYKHEEIERDTYEILIGDMRGLRWVPAHGKLDVNQLGHRPVEGGHENDGSPLYIIKAVYHGGSRPGKASATLDGAYIAAEHTEKNVKDYEVLCYL
ncbi:hypothetical protein H0H93_015986 [Arthromyces matolae]|nr:hypothetical protein H0H93_015986 [Arthromyces matolae]